MVEDFLCWGGSGQIAELWLIFKRNVKSYREFSVPGKIFFKGM